MNAPWPFYFSPPFVFLSILYTVWIGIYWYYYKNRFKLILFTYKVDRIHCNLMIKAKWQWITVNTLFNRLLLQSDEISKYFLLHINLSFNGTSLLLLILISRFSLKMRFTADIDNQIDSTRFIHTYHWLFQQ
jgi:hypothetical protein